VDAMTHWVEANLRARISSVESAVKGVQSGVAYIESDIHTLRCEMRREIKSIQKQIDVLYARLFSAALWASSILAIACWIVLFVSLRHGFHQL